MLKLFGKYIIGGETGKREQAWAVFLMWAAAFVWFTIKEASGVEMPGTQAILTTTVILVIGNLSLSYGLEWHSAQSAWKGEE